MNQPKILVILGQTATGKSDLAIRLAKKWDGEVISADSRQIYRGMDIGTGKVTKKEMDGIPHHLLDIRDPDQDFSVQEFQKLALEAIKDILSRDKLPIICGGTGFYIQSVVDNLVFEDVPQNIQLRNELEEKTIEELKEILEKIPKEDGAKVDTENKRRLIRAIEIGTHFGKLFCLQKRESPYDFLLIGLSLPSHLLREKIETRLQTRFDAGMIEEVEKLHQEDISWQRLESFGLEYKYIALYLQNQIKSLEELKKTLAIKIGQYAKRQMTWFKRDDRIKWFSPSSYEEIEIHIKNYLQKKD